MKIKHTISFVLLLICIVLTTKGQTVQYVTMVGEFNSVQTNQIVSLVGFDWADLSGGSYINNPRVIGWSANPQIGSINLTPHFNPYVNVGSQTMAFSQIPQIVSGITNISVINGWATFKIETPCTANVISNYVPADAVVIPSSATGNVQIILESSADLVNWTTASPGTYGASSATNRFFRVRAAILP
jgi:hypothetical protein